MVQHSRLVAGVWWLTLIAVMLMTLHVTARQLQQSIQFPTGPTSTTPSTGYQVPQQLLTPQVPSAPVTSNTQPAPGPGLPFQPAAASSGGDPITDPVLQSVLDQHNYYRAAHQVDPLTWSASLAAGAQNWANGCVFQHSGPGENLAMNQPTFTEAVNEWYIEVKQYNFQAGQFSEATGHFTQMVWKGSSQLGCGYAPSCKLYVCHYAPYGNVIGQFVENVFPAVRN